MNIASKIQPGPQPWRKREKHSVSLSEMLCKVILTTSPSITGEFTTYRFQ